MKKSDKIAILIITYEKLRRNHDQRKDKITRNKF